MFHKQAARSLRTHLSSETHDNNPAARPHLVSAGDVRRTRPALPELVAIAARRGSSFLAEAAVLVLVFGLLDVFLQRGHIAIGWAFGALVTSVALLAGSVVTDFGARRWLGAQP
jgi:hypothetical protein